MAFDKVGPEGAPALEADIRAYLDDVNDDERALILEPDYLQDRRDPRLGAGTLGPGGEEPLEHHVGDHADQQHAEEDETGDATALAEPGVDDQGDRQWRGRSRRP